MESVLERAGLCGIELPRFCYHKNLSVAGNCRMCLVEVGGMVKPLASCAVNYSAAVSLFFVSKSVIKARIGVLEFLLSNHPLDCPICDQGGCCDLQDQSFVFGNDRGRFYGFKRSVFDKNCSVLVKTIMSRCIHCTRCVRFCHEVAGIRDLGMLGRGFFSEIGMYVDNIFFSELSGNVIDLCPVGALTSKVLSFSSRSWEILKYNTIDIFDSMASDIVFQMRSIEVLKVLPANIYSWITDKSRFGYDGLVMQRISVPVFFCVGIGKFLSVSWSYVFSYLVRLYVGRDFLVNGFVGKGLSLETVVFFKDFIFLLGGFISSVEHFGPLNSFDFRQEYLLGFSLEDVLVCSLGLLVGFNVRLELPLFASKLRGYVRLGFLVVSLFGPTSVYYFASHKLGNSLSHFCLFLEGMHSYCVEVLLAERMFTLVGFLFYNWGAIFKRLYWLRVSVMPSFLFGFLQSSLHLIGYWDIGLGISSSLSKKVNMRTFNCFLGCDNVNITSDISDFSLYMGSHISIPSLNASMLLPVSTIFEVGGSFLDISGKLRSIGKFFSRNLLYFRGYVSVICNLMKFFTLFLCYFIQDSFVFQRLSDYLWGNALFLKSILYVSCEFNFIFSNIVFNNLVSNYYMSDILSKNSSTMGRVSQKMENFVNNYNVIV